MCKVVVKPSLFPREGTKGPRPPLLPESFFKWCDYVGGVGLMTPFRGKVVVERFAPTERGMALAYERYVRYDKSGRLVVVHIRSSDNEGVDNTHPFFIPQSDQRLALCQADFVNGSMPGFYKELTARRTAGPYCDTRLFAEEYAHDIVTYENMTREDTRAQLERILSRFVLLRGDGRVVTAGLPFSCYGGVLTNSYSLKAWYSEHEASARRPVRAKARVFSHPPESICARAG